MEDTISLFFFRYPAAQVIVGLIVLLIVYYVAKKFFSFDSHTYSNLALEKFFLNTETINQEDKSEIFFEISARKAGLISWILTNLNIGTRLRLILNQRELLLLFSNLNADILTSTPLVKLSSISGGYVQRVEYLVVLIASVILGLLFSKLFFIVTVVCLLLYIFRKDLFLKITTESGHVFTFKFVPSVIEGVLIDRDKVTEAVGSINTAVLKILNSER